MSEHANPALRLLMRHLMRFTAVGLMGAALDYAVLMALIQLGAGNALARVPAVGITFAFTWFLNRSLTFATKHPPSWSEFSRYTLAAIGGIAINLGVYWVALAIHAPVWGAFVAGTGTAAIYTFLNYRKVLHDA